MTFMKHKSDFHRLSVGASHPQSQQPAKFTFTGGLRRRQIAFCTPLCGFSLNRPLLKSLVQFYSYLHSCGEVSEAKLCHHCSLRIWWNCESLQELHRGNQPLPCPPAKRPENSTCSAPQRRDCSELRPMNPPSFWLPHAADNLGEAPWQISWPRDNIVWARPLLFTF